jgi:hypothetical protein
LRQCSARVSSFSCRCGRGVRPLADDPRSPFSGLQGWKVGWGLAASSSAGAVSQLAVLRCPAAPSDVLEAVAGVSWSSGGDEEAGAWIAAVGSPFGCLSRHHFANTTTVGVVANTFGTSGAVSVCFAGRQPFETPRSCGVHRQLSLWLPPCQASAMPWVLLCRGQTS